MNKITEKFLQVLAEYQGKLQGAYSLRENGCCISSHSTKNVVITPKKDQPGIDITVLPGTKGETISIPSCVTQGGIDDVVFNDFHVGKDCDIKIISGCGVHTEDDSMAKHNGIHRFFLAENAHVNYEEKHMGTGEGTGVRSINPVTEAYLEADSCLEINASQISGVDIAYRSTKAFLGAGARFVVHERLFTEKEQKTKTIFKVELNGDGSSADVVSRSVAKDYSVQTMDSLIVGNAVCTGHSECDAIIDDEAIVDAAPRLNAHNKEASLIHEAAIGKIAGEQILKLRTLGLTEEEAEQEIINGFLA